MKSLAFAAAAAVLALAPYGHAAAGDAAEGEKVFRKCQACHTIEPGKHRVGPSLHGVVGRQAGTAEGYTRYVGLEDVDFEWNDALLQEYLADPRAFVREHTDNKRSAMAFKLPKQEERDDVIAYLKTLE